MTHLDDVFDKAVAAYLSGGGIEQPSFSGSSCTTHKGLEYVVLRNIRGVLAVYRIMNDGMLKQMLRWPKALNQY